MIHQRTTLRRFLSVAAAASIAMLLGFLSISHAEGEEAYDLVIRNGRVMDPETMYDAVANVGIKDGRIAAITTADIQGDRVIDATGHVVTAGFIDTHFHWTRTLGYKIALRDGVTTAMDTEYGCVGTRVAEWYDVRKGKTQMNYGTASSHEAARQLVLDKSPVFDAPAGIVGRKAKLWYTKKLDLESGNAVLQVIDKGLQDGAVAIGSTLGYMRDAVTAREMLEVQRVGARYGRHTSVHTRSTPGTSTTEVNGSQEILANAVALGAPASIAHFNNPGWDVVHELLQNLRARGHNVWGEIYPYAAGSTTLNAVFIQPRIWLDDLGKKYEDTLQDPETGEFYTRERYEKDLRETPTKEIILYKAPKEDIVSWLRLRGATMGSDAMWADPMEGPWETPYEKMGATHPRLSGSRGLSLRLARENGIPLMQVLAQLSYNSAKRLGDLGLVDMQERGRMQVGMVADIAIFDPGKVRENSTYKRGVVPTTGMPYVIVNGVVVVEDSKVLKVFPGQPIRFDPESRPRFRPVDPKHWERMHMAAAGACNACGFGLPEGHPAHHRHGAR